MDRRSLNFDRCRTTVPTSKFFHWPKAVPAHHTYCTANFMLELDSTLNIGSFPMPGFANDMVLAAMLALRDPTRRWPFHINLYALLSFWSIVVGGLFGHFSNCHLLLALYFCVHAQSHFQLTHPSGNHHSYLRLLSCTLSIWASIKASSSPISASSIKPCGKSLHPFETPILSVSPCRSSS